MRIAATLLGIFAISATVRAQDSPQVGYATLTASPGGSLPVASSLFTYTNANGVLVSQAAVAAARPILSGVVFVDQSGTRTGLALANPGNQTADVTLILRDAFGFEVARIPQPIGANQHVSRYVSQLFSQLPANFLGSLTFDSNLPIAAVALRERSNARGEPLYSSMPVLDANSPPPGPPILFPHLVVGGGYATQIVLVNTTNQVLLGRCALITSSGQPLTVDDGARSEFNYRIEPRGVFRADLGNTALAVGYAVVYPDPGSPSPSGNAIFQYNPGGSPVTEASVGATAPTTASRLFVDNTGTQTGIAIANPGMAAAVMTITLLDRYGNIEAQVDRTLASGNHVSLFARELFPSAVYDGFSGLIEIRSAVPVVPIALKLTDNSRQEQILTTLPVADLNTPALTDTVVFPQIAIGGGFSTRLLYVNPSTSVGAAGTLRFRESSGAAMTIPLMGQPGDQFDVQILAGQGRQAYPGNAARVANISLLDPATNQPTTELTINEGNFVRPRTQILDSMGSRRDDYDAVVGNSSDPEVATIDASGTVFAKKVGFSSITVSAGGMVESATVNVFGLNTGGVGYNGTGVVQDRARRLYVASTTDHNVVRADDFRQSPTPYAGIARSPGLRNDKRLQSQFRNPAFLALNQYEGSLYVSDSANNLIRRVFPGDGGSVVTFAGTGTSGNVDGSLLQSSFNNPQGVALDRRGNLWIADSGNHTIRLIDVSTGTVRTVAGVAGVAGAVDGVGAQARFSSPRGIAFESESLAQQLERDRKGEAAPPVSVIVADTGSGKLRRVRENGVVETLVSLPFDSPVAVTVDPAGNIFVSEAGSGSVRTLLRSGQVVAAAQKDSLRNPRGIVATENGRILVIDSERSLQEIRYGAPHIGSVAPNHVAKNGGDRVTISGANFAPDTVVFVGGVPITSLQISDTQTMAFTTPPLPSGRNVLTIQNRGGIAQAPLLVGATSLSDLQPGYITTVAGGSTFAGEGTPALAVKVSADAVEMDSGGNVFIADTENHRVRRIDARTGIITTVAGTAGRQLGDGGLAVASALNHPNAVAFDLGGNLLIADETVKRVDAVTGMLTTIVGGSYGFSGDGGPALGAGFLQLVSIALDADGNLYISDLSDHRIRRVDGKTRIITTLAGTGIEGFGGDGGPANSARLNRPWGLTVDNNRKVLYFADHLNNRVRQVDLSGGSITTIAGGAPYTASRGNGGPATGAFLDGPADVKLDTNGNLLISESGRVRRVDILTGDITTVAGNEFLGYAGDGGPATSASLSSETRGLAVDASGNIFIADKRNSRIRRVDAATRTIDTIAGNGTPSEIFDNEAATAATLRHPTAISKDARGNLYITDSDNNRIRRVDAATGTITTIAGGGAPLFGIGDNGHATEAKLNGPRGRVAFDSSGNMFFADTYHYRVRRIDAVSGFITSVAGNGLPHFVGDGISPLQAGMTPLAVVLDDKGNLYIADDTEPRIFKVDVSLNLLTTFAGGGQPDDGLGDNGAADRAALGNSLKISIDAAGNLFVTDTEKGRVRKIDASTRIITTVAGGGGPYRENMPATQVTLIPIDAMPDTAGNLYIIDNNVSGGVRRVQAGPAGLIQSVAGVGPVTVDLGDNGLALKSSVYYPRGIFIDAEGTLYIADTDNQRIRAVRGPIP
jgi:sugar lactone lactonase YvrE